MDRFERARQLRDDYESSLDEAEKLRARYHREVLKLHRSGLSLREIAEQLGISHQRVHQIVGVAEEPRRRGRMLGGAAGAIVLLGGSIVGWVALHDGSASVRVSPRAPAESQASVRTTFCDLAAVPGQMSGLPRRSTTARAQRCLGPGSSVVVLDAVSGNILAMASYGGPVVSIDRQIGSLDRRLQSFLEGLLQGGTQPSDQGSL